MLSSSRQTFHATLIFLPRESRKLSLFFGFPVESRCRLFEFVEYFNNLLAMGMEDD